MTVLQIITKKAKAIRAATPKLTWQQAIKAASKEYNKMKPAAKKPAAKKPATKKPATKAALLKAKRAAIDKHLKKRPKSVKLVALPIKKISGKPKAKAFTPKPANLNFEALNGIIVFKTGGYYEVIGGKRKGDVFKITRKTKVGNYHVNYYANLGRNLSKPFLGEISQSWINEHSILPRAAVKSHETIVII